MALCLITFLDWIILSAVKSTKRQNQSLQLLCLALMSTSHDHELVLVSKVERMSVHQVFSQ